MSITEGFRDVLDDEQLENVDCAALKLSAAVTDYLAGGIEFLLGTRLSFDLTFQQTP